MREDTTAGAKNNNRPLAQGSSPWVPETGCMERRCGLGFDEGVCVRAGFAGWDAGLFSRAKKRLSRDEGMNDGRVAFARGCGR